MATTRVFSDEDLERLRSFPEINREELIRFFTLTSADVEFIDPGRGRGPGDRLGLAVQLCTLPWLGFVPDDVTSAPAVTVARLSERLQVPIGELGSYGERDQTRTDHLRSVARYLGWRQASALEHQELDEFLLARAMEHDSPTLLFRLACEHLISARVIRPGVVRVIERVATAREAAGDATFDRVVHLLTAQRQVDLDKLLVVDDTVGSTRLAMAGQGSDRGIGLGGQGRTRQTAVSARSRCPHAGPVGAAGRTAPVPGCRRPPADRAGTGSA